MNLAARLFALVLLAFPLGGAHGAEQQPLQDTYVAPLADPVLEARAKALQRELRCVVCQGQSIDELNAPLAADMRRLIREQIQDGKSDDNVKEFLVARYGTFVLMNPPVSGDTYFLWFGPSGAAPDRSSRHRRDDHAGPPAARDGTGPGGALI